MPKTILITGATDGIGLLTAKTLAAQGHTVLLHGRSAEKLEAAAKEVGGTPERFRADLSRLDEVGALAEEIQSRHDRIDVLINNAGIVGTTAKLTEIDHARLVQIMNVNVIGAMLVAKEAVIRMQAQGTGGAIINISSAAARLGSGNQYVDYAASKGAIDTFTKGLADEVASDNIRVMSIRPGIIATDIHSKGGEPDRAERLAPMVPLKRAGSAEEVAQAILWLASSQASYITGSTLDVTGGR